MAWAATAGGTTVALVLRAEEEEEEEEEEPGSTPTQITSESSPPDSTDSESLLSQRFTTSERRNRTTGETTTGETWGGASCALPDCQPSAAAVAKFVGARRNPDHSEYATDAEAGEERIGDIGKTKADRGSVDCLFSNELKGACGAAAAEADNGVMTFAISGICRKLGISKGVEEVA
jgi:hypothetical protein